LQNGRNKLYLEKLLATTGNDKILTEEIWRYYKDVLSNSLDENNLKGEV